MAAAGNPNIKDDLLKGVQLGDQTYKNHLDSYNQMDLITGKGPSARHEIIYFAENNLGAVRYDDYKYQFITQPGGWLGTKDHPDLPGCVNLRLDPFEKMGFVGVDGNRGSFSYFGWFVYEFWRFVLAQQIVAKLAMSAIDYPPMQKGASFNLDAVKEKIAAAMAKHGQ